MSPTTMQVNEVDRVTVWVVTDNYYDALRPDAKFARRYRAEAAGTSIHAEHGLCYYIETVVGGKSSGCMFDFGQDSRGVANNLALLGIELGNIKAFSLSHGHFDHFLAALPILESARAFLAAGTPFYVGEECFSHRYLLRPGDTSPMDLGRLKKEDIEALGLTVVEVSEPIEIIPGAYLTGNIERVTPYEKVPPVLLIERGEKPEPDDFRGEQAIFFNVKGKGLVVLSGCAHAGIVNTVEQARKVSGIEKIHAVMGGFHLINAKPEIIKKTVEDIKAMQPDCVVPTHCTGFEALEAFKREMVEEFTLNTAGSRYTFEKN
ncbi:MAG: MBL fold metallo-hydrolase [Syntrophobacteraceae bacterium]|nr:MBL fold metallo-hydrolase [Syntrophobacteraceae bacterium]